MSRTEYKLKLKQLKDKIDKMSKAQGSNLVANEIREVVSFINNWIVENSRGKSSHSQTTIKEPWLLFKKLRTVSDIADHRTYKFFLSANSHLSWYLPHSMSFPYKKYSISNSEFPIIKPVLNDSSLYREIDIRELRSVTEAKNSSELYYPLNIVFFNGDDLQNLINYSKDTRFPLNSFCDLSPLYQIYYFDFDSKCYRFINGNKKVKSTFESNDAVFYLNQIPEFGYLFELGRLNLAYEEHAPALIKFGMKELRKSELITKEEYGDYIRYMMVEFSKYHHDIKQSQIKLLSNSGYVSPGMKCFIVLGDSGTMGIRVELEKYGADQNNMIWDEKIVEAAELLSNSLPKTKIYQKIE